MPVVSKAETDEEKAVAEVEERTAPPGRVVYEAIYREGEHELERNGRALAWSGLAAGLSMGFSFLMEGVLRDFLPPGCSPPTLAKFGYSIGFLIVILGRQQLFTKNTVTVILPLLKQKEAGLFQNVARLWVIVLITNVIGALAFATLISQTGICIPIVRAQLVIMSHEAVANPFGNMLLRSILAGWLIALMIWLLPFAETAHIWVIVFLAYLLGIGHLPHIVAGSVPSLYAVLIGDASVGRWATNFFFPVLIGNAIGGVAVVALIAHAEFVEESRAGENSQS